MNDTIVRLIEQHDAQRLADYFTRLRADSSTLFAPHPLTADAAAKICSSDDEFSRHYIATHTNENLISAYAVVSTKFSNNDTARLFEAGVSLSNEKDCAFAPSVDSNYRGRGLAQLLLNFIIQDLTRMGKERLFLWGGVQNSNERAMAFYRKSGFRSINTFERGDQKNTNMCLDLRQLEK